MRRSANGLRTVQFASLSFDVSFHEIFSTLGNGGTLVLLREETRRDAGALLQLLIRERIERLFLPYVALQYLAEAAERQDKFPTTLREVIRGGEQLKITRHIRRLFAKLEGCTLDNNYGPSETHAVCALMLDGDLAAWPELPSIGRPSANTQLYLLDERMQAGAGGRSGRSVHRVRRHGAWLSESPRNLGGKILAESIYGWRRSALVSNRRSRALPG